MNKTAIKNFAIWARQKLISDIKYKAGMLGITENGIAEKLPQSTADLHFFDIGTKNYSEVSGVEVKQRDALVKAIHAREHSFKSFREALDNTVEEVAYTWFNRLIAIRFMEVNDYLPSGIRVLSSENKAKNEPDFVTTPFDTDLDFNSYEQDRVIQLKDENKLDELFRMLFIKQCNKLNEILPKLFEKTDDYTELLLTISFIDKDGVVYRLVHDIDEDDFNVEKEGQVQIIGWLYQYYNTEPKDETFSLLKKNEKITKERIPFVTQLFTPDWIVRYMVENSLGRLWLEGHPDDELKSGWKYYLDEAEQEAEVQAQLDAIRAERRDLRPQDIKLIDPCMGSGHILVYAFDVLVQIYKKAGFSERDAAQSILKNNLYGLDIDKRAAQLAYFAVMMKARQYDRRIFACDIQPNIFAIAESGHFDKDGKKVSAIDPAAIEAFIGGRPEIKANYDLLFEQMFDAKEYGSVISVDGVDFDSLYARYDETVDEVSLYHQVFKEELIPLIQIAEMLSQKYDVAVTNPPYMAISNSNNKLQEFAKNEYPDSKTDLFAMFFERCRSYAKPSGYFAMITQHAWMFLSSFEKLRQKIQSVEIVNMAHLGARAFEDISGEIVQTTSFVIRSSFFGEYAGLYCRLIGPTTQQGKENMFLAGENRYIAMQSNFSKIPNSPVAYWVSEKFIAAFENPLISSIAFSDGQILTGDNNKYLRLMWEVDRQSIEDRSKWVLHAKGGGQRRWYGNIDTVVSWSEESINHYKSDSIARFPKKHVLFQKGITWSLISSSDMFSMRILTADTTFNKAAATILFYNNTLIQYVLAFLNTKVTRMMLTTMNPTLNTNIKDILGLPIILPQNNENKIRIDKIVEENIVISKSDWDSFETSWDFKRHPLLPQPKEDNNLYFCLKIGKEKWVKALRYGSICFNTVDYYIKKAEKGCNNEQGDLYEGVFARLHKTNPKITEMQDKLGSDLEIIPDGDYVMLRRYSTRNIPVFCIYGIFREDLKPIEDEIKNNDGTYTFNVRIDISSKMYSDLLKKNDNSQEDMNYWGFYVSSGHFFNAVETALNNRNYTFKRNRINYTIQSKDEFFIEPTDSRDELFYKRPHYSYQNEERIVLPDLQRNDELVFDYEPVGDKSGIVAQGALYFKAPLTVVKGNSVLISDRYEAWSKKCDIRFNTLKSNEEELNRIFIDIYGLQDELTPEVEDKDVTVRKADLQRDIKSFISYAVGCMFGRYSLDMEGLAYAGGEWDNRKYTVFLPDEDNCIPITDEEYLKDDIVNRFVEFVEVVYGKQALEENLSFIANALGNKGNTSRDVIRNYFLNDFIKDHIRIYQKRPIYWLFDSGKQNGFKALCYMHRWNADTTGNMRVEYLHRMQRVYEKEINRMQEIISGSDDSKEISNAMKRKEKLQKQLKETKDYDAQVAHLALSRINIDLDDGVKVNYEKVQTASDGRKLQILTKI